MPCYLHHNKTVFIGGLPKRTDGLKVTGFDVVSTYHIAVSRHLIRKDNYLI